MMPQRDRWLGALAFIILAYVVLASLYAWQTPRWQAADEPAHYNYIQYVVAQGRLPVLQAGDFPYEYLEAIKAAKFPPNMSVETIRYESHQPPLYYVLAAAVYRLTAALGFDRQFLSLRLLSVLLGAIALYLTHRLVRSIFPEDKLLALAAPALVAVIPMQLTVTSSINNDPLAEVLAVAVLYHSVETLHRGLYGRRAAVAGVLFGLALLTKSTIYVCSAAAIVLSVFLRRRLTGSGRARREWTAVRYLLCVLALGLLISAPFFVRNALVYGVDDILAWQRHDAVATAQLHTADLLAQIGPVRLVGQFLQTTFRSFWAQFGWMGVVVDQRIYSALLLFTALMGTGVVLFAVRVRQRRSGLSRTQRYALWLAVIHILLAALAYLWYNVKFVQHQGRYLFVSLAPLALAGALGLEESLRPRTARFLAAAAASATLVLLVSGFLSGDIAKSAVAMLAAEATVLAGAGFLPRWWRFLTQGLLYAAMLFLDYVCLFHYIVPALSRGR
jgi:hypothetical protein